METNLQTSALSELGFLPTDTKRDTGCFRSYRFFYIRNSSSLSCWIYQFQQNHSCSLSPESDRSLLKGESATLELLWDEHSMLDEGLKYLFLKLRSSHVDPGSCLFISVNMLDVIRWDQKCDVTSRYTVLNVVHRSQLLIISWLLNYTLFKLMCSWTLEESLLLHSAVRECKPIRN